MPLTSLFAKPRFISVLIIIPQIRLFVNIVIGLRLCALAYHIFVNKIKAQALQDLSLAENCTGAKTSLHLVLLVGLLRSSDYYEVVYSLRLMIYSLWRDMLVKADDILALARYTRQSG